MLEVRDLDLYYGDAQALDRVSLTVEEGQIIAIVGANGAGKSSLIRAIAGIERPRSGQILFRGRDITALESYVTCDLGIGQVAEGSHDFLLRLADQYQVLHPLFHQFRQRRIIAPLVPAAGNERNITVEALQGFHHAPHIGPLAVVVPWDTVYCGHQFHAVGKPREILNGLLCA